MRRIGSVSPDTTEAAALDIALGKKRVKNNESPHALTIKEFEKNLQSVA